MTTCPKCSSRNLFIEDGEWACLPCGWRAARPPTRDERKQSGWGHHVDPRSHASIEEIREQLNEAWDAAREVQDGQPATQ